MPSRARVDLIRFTIRVRSPTRQSRSRFGRLASSSAIVGTRAMVQWPALHAATPRTRASATRCRAGRFSLGDAPARPRGSRHGSREPRHHAPQASAPARSRRGRLRNLPLARTGGKRNPRDRAAGPDRLIPPAMQQAKQSFWARLQLLARLTLNAGKHAGNQPARLAQLDDGNDRVILVQGDEGLAQSLPWRKPGSFGWGIAALHRLDAATKLPFLAARPIASLGPLKGPAWRDDRPGASQQHIATAGGGLSARSRYLSAISQGVARRAPMRAPRTPATGGQRLTRGGTIAVPPEPVLISPTDGKRSVRASFTAAVLSLTCLDRRVDQYPVAHSSGNPRAGLRLSLAARAPNARRSDR